MTLARTAPREIPARVRIPTNVVWQTVVFALNILAFIIIGLQIRPILEELQAGDRTRYLLFAAAVLATVIVVRIAWHMPFNAVVRWRHLRYGYHPPRPMLRPTVGSGLVISWAGMRGIVSLAAALALPPDFPFRGLILLTASAVVLGTLVIQGLTLKPLMRALDLHDGDPVADEIRQARERALEAGLGSVDGDRSHAADLVRRDFAARLGRRREKTGAAADLQSAYTGLHGRAVQAARQALLAMREAQEIGDDAFHALEDELDWIEVSSAAKAQ
jgi:CPA1 family monovalent cation:H+ antiporter